MPKRHSLKLILLIAVTLVAAFFRLYRIDVLPPGVGYDAAYYGLDALTILDGEWPVFFETNYGRESLFSYLVAVCVALFGVGPQAIHLASAVVGVLTVPAVYLVAEELFAEEGGLLGRYGSLTAVLALALSFWHLSWSRHGVRAILTPLFTALSMYLFWRGVRTNKWWVFAACGLVLGLGLYTYQATRLLPVLVVATFAYVAWVNRSPGKVTLSHLVIVAAVAFLVFAPLGLYIASHPGSFGARVAQVSVLHQDHPFEALLQGLKQTVLVLGFHGDERPSTNIPGRPALNPFFFGALALGVIVSLGRIKRSPYPVLLAWLAIMGAPGILAQQGPTAKRIIGSLPAIVMFIAVGILVPLEALRRVAVRDWRHRGRQQVWATAGVTLLALVVVAGFVYSGIGTYRDYFEVWGRDPALFTHYEAGLGAIGQYIAGRPATERIYVSPVDVAHPSILYNSRERGNVKGYNGNHCMVLPYQAGHDTSFVVVPAEDRRSLEWLSEYLPQAELIERGPLHYDEPYFLAYHVPAEAEVQFHPTRARQTTWDGKIQLLGDDLFPEDQFIRLRLYLRALDTIERDYTAFVQLVGPDNPATGTVLWSQMDAEPCKRYRPTSSWDVDEILVDEIELAVPAQGMVDQAYQVILGFYTWQTGERLPIQGTAGSEARDFVSLYQGHFENTPGSETQTFVLQSLP